MTGLRWGLVGVSDIAARSLMPAIRAQPASTVVAVHSRSAERGLAYARRWGIPRSCARLDDLLADPAIDAVYVSTTNDRHRDETVSAARAGKHVLCEKPLALSLDDAAAMVAACRDARVVLATNHGRRNDPAVRAVRDLVRDGRLGTLLAARTSNAVLLPPRLRGWRLSEPGARAGAVLDLVVHEADTLRFVLGDEPLEVTGLTAALGMASPGIEDEVMGVLRLRSGLLASFFCAFTTPYGEVGLEVHGSTGSVRTQRGGDGPTRAVLRHGGLDGPPGAPRGGEEWLELPAPESVGALTVRAFEAAVRGQGTPSATGEDGLRSLAVALATLESAGTGRTVRL